MGHTELRVV